MTAVAKAVRNSSSLAHFSASNRAMRRDSFSESWMVWLTSDVFPVRRGEIRIVLIPWRKLAQRCRVSSVRPAKVSPLTGTPNSNGGRILALYDTMGSHFLYGCQSGNASVSNKYVIDVVAMIKKGQASRNETVRLIATDCSYASRPTAGTVSHALSSTVFLAFGEQGPHYETSEESSSIRYKRPALWCRAGLFRSVSSHGGRWRRASRGSRRSRCCG